MKSIYKEEVTTGCMVPIIKFFSAVTFAVVGLLLII